MEVDVMKKALLSSGYLLENRLCGLLDHRMYFVSPNDTFSDPVTGKSREVDIYAESQGPRVLDTDVAVSINLIFECINNLYPLVVFRRASPRDNDHFETGIRYFETNLKSLVDLERQDFGLSDKYIGDLKTAATQYCSFSEKKSGKGDFMASHPDDLNSTFSKMVAFIDQKMLEVKTRFPRPDHYIRFFIFHPIVVLQNDIFEAVVDGNDLTLNEVDQYEFEYNFSDKDKKSIFVTFVRESGLKELLDRIDFVESRMHADLVSLSDQGVKMKSKWRKLTSTST